jgi:hypothetical protein
MPLDAYRPRNLTMLLTLEREPQLGWLDEGSIIAFEAR